jgi:HD-GYP domain-containing protein (c-di-GMP phosphodiesterase class II)
MRLVPIECVKEGSILAKTIFDGESRILLREGVMLSVNLIKKIKSIKVFSIYIVDEYSTKEIEDIIKPELRQKAITTIKDTFYSFKRFSIGTTTSSSSDSNTLLKKKSEYFSSINQIAEELLEELLCKKNVLVSLVDIKSMDDYTYQHSVNVAVLSLVLGLQLQLNRYELYNLCVGALVHDIGKILIPKELVLKPGKLTHEEFETIKQHSVRGYEYLKNASEIPATARIISLQHHERYDGKGYPENRDGESISKLSRIVAIVDVYDALTSDRPYRRALNPSEAIEYIMANGSSHFDYSMVKSFAKVVIPYAEGTIVKLSNGDYAVVEEVFPEYPLRPNVKIIKSIEKARENTFINLMTTLDLVIISQEYNVPD